MGKQTAIVVVNKDWFNSGGRILVGNRRSSSTGQVHIVTAALKDASGPVGVWLENIKREGFTTDGSELIMDVLIPWSAIVSLGIFEGSEDQIKVGFAAD